jgi:hypothetical protein
MQNVSLLVDYFITLIRFALDSVVMLERSFTLSTVCFFSAHLMAAHCSHVIFHRHRSELLARGFTFRVGGGFIHQFARDRFTSFFTYLLFVA